jgi:hypothetical protein
MSEALKKVPADGNEELKWLELVIQQVGSLRYGVVEIVVHDSRVIQIEKTERLRLGKTSDENRPDRTK